MPPTIKNSWTPGRQTKRLATMRGPGGRSSSRQSETSRGFTRMNADQKNISDPRLSAQIRGSFFRQHLSKKFNRPRIAGFAKRANRLLAHKLIRMRLRDLDQQR